MSVPPHAKVIAPEDGKTLKLFGVRFNFKIETADAGGNLALMEVEIPPHTLVKPHNHTREDEYSLIMSGTVGVRVGDDVQEATAGSYLVKPRGIPHAMWNAGPEPAKVMEILSPGGMEKYFEELAPILAHEGGAGPAQYYELAQNYGLTIQDDWIEELETTYGVKL